MNYLYEDSRSQLLSKSKKADNYASSNQNKGKNRYERRVHSKVSHSVRDYNSIDMNRLFKDNILDVNVAVKGETDNYEVKVTFSGFLDNLHRELKNNNDILNLRCISRALSSAFNSDNVYVACSCPDWQYRISYYATKNSTTSGLAELRPSQITNPTDSKGAGCKHSLLVLSNNSWLIKVASVIFNYVNYMEKHFAKLYADIIYPAIYERDYEDEVQLDIFDIEDNEDNIDLDTDADTIKKSNEYARTKSQFKQGNEYRFTKQDNTDDKQLDFDTLLKDIPDEEE